MRGKVKLVLSLESLAIPPCFSLGLKSLQSLEKEQETNWRTRKISQSCDRFDS